MTNKRFIAILIAETIILSSVVAAVIVFDIAELMEPQYTTRYETINVSQAKELIATATNLTVIDCRPGCGPCQFKKGHLPGAILTSNPSAFYNYSCDFLVYCNTGKTGAKFCISLLNHTYGKIYNLDGGWNAWNG